MHPTITCRRTRRKCYTLPQEKLLPICSDKGQILGFHSVKSIKDPSRGICSWCVARRVGQLVVAPTINFSFNSILPATGDLPHPSAHCFPKPSYSVILELPLAVDEELRLRDQVHGPLRAEKDCDRWSLKTWESAFHFCFCNCLTCIWCFSYA